MRQQYKLNEWSHCQKQNAVAQVDEQAINPNQKHQMEWTSNQSYFQWLQRKCDHGTNLQFADDNNLINLNQQKLTLGNQCYLFNAWNLKVFCQIKGQAYNGNWKNIWTNKIESLHNHEKATQWLSAISSRNLFKKTRNILESQQLFTRKMSWKADNSSTRECIISNSPTNLSHQ